MDLGCGDLITAIDTQTEAYALEGVPAGLPAFDMQAPDTEALAALEPDVVFVSGVSVIEGENMFQPLVDMGVCIVSIPTSSSIAAVEEEHHLPGRPAWTAPRKASRSSPTCRPRSTRLPPSARP